MGRHLVRARELATSIGVALFFALLIRSYVAQAFTIPSGSMRPTLKERDMLIANRLMYRARALTPSPPLRPNCREMACRCRGVVCRGEVVIFIAPHTREPRRQVTLLPELHTAFFHFPGLHISYGDRLQHFFASGLPSRICPSCGYVWKDFIKRVIGLPGETVEIRDGMVFIDGEELTGEEYIQEPPYYRDGPHKIPEGHVFVMGDNRNNSEDSHVWGPLPISYIRGKALFVYWPPRRIRFIE